MVTLYADMVCDASKGEVQLLLKEEYLSGEPGWPKTLARQCLPLRAYRMLGPAERRNVAVVLKIGTYDDTLASHFVVVDPVNPGSPDEDDVPILDLAQPRKPGKRVWRLSDSSRWIRQDDEIDKAWRKHRISDLQLAGVWVFARWVSTDQALLGSRFIAKLGLLVYQLPERSRRRSCRRSSAFHNLCVGVVFADLPPELRLEIAQKLLAADTGAA